jgi:hypothetical protein
MFLQAACLLRADFRKDLPSAGVAASPVLLAQLVRV